MSSNDIVAPTHHVGLHKSAATFPAVDGLRAASALFVVASHSMLEIWPPWGLRPDPNVLLWLSGVFIHSRLAVDVFIVISGFCLGYPIISNSYRLEIGPFFLRRARRILPPYFAAVLLCLVLIKTCLGGRTGTLWDMSIGVTPFGIFAHFVLLQDVFASSVGGQINSVFWSLAVEAHLYCMVPLFLIFWRRHFSLTIVVLVVGTTLLAIIGPDWLVPMRVQFVGLFSLGAAAANIVHRETRGNGSRRLASWTLPAALIATVPFFAAFLLLPIRLIAALYPVLEVWSGLCAAIWIVHLTVRPTGILARIAGASPWARLGSFSFSLYLIHLPILHSINLLLLRGFHYNQEIRYYILSVVGIPISAAFAYLFYCCFEKPFLSRRPANPLLARAVA